MYVVPQRIKKKLKVNKSKRNFLNNNSPIVCKIMQKILSIRYLIIKFMVFNVVFSAVYFYRFDFHSTKHYHLLFIIIAIFFYLLRLKIDIFISFYCTHLSQ